MKYSGRSQFDHSEPPRIGVLITNLGTPDAPTAPALRRYLKEFLSDPRVIEVNRLLWWFILRIILIFRPARSAKAYQSIWSEDAALGSPLAENTRKQADALRAEFGESVLIDWGMRYGKPAIAERIDAMLEQGVRKLLVLPLYPQYSASTTASTFDAVAKDFVSRRWLPALRFVDSYHTHPAYIAALCSSIEQHWQSHSRAEKLVFTYHGVPLRYLHAGDPYHCQCLRTTRMVAEKLGLKKEEYITTFQSRFGREAWLQPYTDETLKTLASEGCKSVQLICPGFSADCLETIEEIGEENRDYFIEAGGESYEYIAALNDRPEHIAFLKSLIEENLQGWSTDNKTVSEKQKQLADEYPHNRIN